MFFFSIYFLHGDKLNFCVLINLEYIYIKIRIYWVDVGTLSVFTCSLNVSCVCCGLAIDKTFLFEYFFFVTHVRLVIRPSSWNSVFTLIPLYFWLSSYFYDILVIKWLPSCMFDFGLPIIESIVSMWLQLCSKLHILAWLFFASIAGKPCVLFLFMTNVTNMQMGA